VRLCPGLRACAARLVLLAPLGHAGRLEIVERTASQGRKARLARSAPLVRRASKARPASAVILVRLESEATLASPGSRASAVRQVRRACAAFQDVTGATPYRLCRHELNGSAG